MGFNTEALGAWGEPFEFKVERDRVIAYAKATNDQNPRHLSGELAPPVFAIVPVFGGMAGSMPSVVPAEAFPFLLHGEQDMVFHQPIVPGMTLVSRGRPAGLSVKKSGTTLSVQLETRTAEGDLVNEQWMVAFFRGFSDGGGRRSVSHGGGNTSAGDNAPAHPFDEALRGNGPLATVTQHVDDDQTYRYSEASGDPMPIHLDDAVAKAAGLPGIIAHGLCTMAFTSRAVIESVAGNDPTRLKRLAVRFSRPVLPGEDVTTSIYDAGSGTYAFETVSSGGNVVIKDGRAEVA